MQFSHACKRRRRWAILVTGEPPFVVQPPPLLSLGTLHGDTDIFFSDCSEEGQVLPHQLLCFLLLCCPFPRQSVRHPQRLPAPNPFSETSSIRDSTASEVPVPCFVVEGCVTATLTDPRSKSS